LRLAGGQSDWNASTETATSPLNQENIVRHAALAGLLAIALLGCIDPVGTARHVVYGPGSPIINGAFDGNGHPNVGALLYDFGGDGLSATDAVCSGVLIAPAVFLTAGHCLSSFPSGSAFSVTFDPNLMDNAGVPSGIIAAVSATVNPAFLQPPKGGFSAGDLGIVMLPAGSTAGITPAALPTLNWLSNLSPRTLRASQYENVGYGMSASHSGKPSFVWIGARHVSTSPFMSMSSTRLGLQMNVAATGQGGDCYGDSGSPKFVPGTNTIVGITSWGDIQCRATSWSVRLDTPQSRSFLSDFVAVP
jgi:V8-like Glu-specific endopeptidase